jgi:hypothetical protein
VAEGDKHRDIRDYDEVGVDVVGKDWKNDDVFRIWAKNMLIVEQQRDYWKKYIERGKTCFDFYRGEIFDDETREVYEDVEDKYVVEPNKMKAPINALVGELMQSRRSGQITVEGGNLMTPEGRSAEIQTVNMVLKHMERRWDEKKLQGDILQDGMIATYPVWAWFEPSPLSDIPEKGPYHPVILPWDSVYPTPFNFRSPIGKDIIGMSRFQYMSPEQLIDMFPDQADVIQDYLNEIRGRLKDDKLNFDHIDNWDFSFDANQRQDIIFFVMTGINELMAPEGYFGVWERNFVIRMDEVVAVDVFNPENIEIRPPEWEERRWQQFLASQAERQNTKFVESIRPVKILYSTVSTTCGLVLFNEPHWFQENGRLPGIPLTPAMIDSIPEGPAKDMLSDQLAIAVARTEELDDIRKNTGSITISREGSIQNIDDMPEELNKAHGHISIKEEAGPIPSVIQEWKRQPTKEFTNYALERERDMQQVTMINPAVMGQHVPEQSGRAKQIEIARALITQSIYVDNWNAWVRAWNNLRLRLIPYIYDHYDVLEIEDAQAGQIQTQAVNIPQVDMNGNVVSVTNDLTSHRYQWVMQEVDDSATAKEQEYKQALVFLNAVPGPVVQADPSGKLLSRFMLAMPNRFLNEAGRALAQDADMRVQAQTRAQQREELAKLQETMAKLRIDAERAKKQGVNVTLTGDNLAQYPAFFEWLRAFGMPVEQPGQAGQPPAPQGAARPTPAQQPTPAPAAAPAGATA